MYFWCIFCLFSWYFPEPVHLVFSGACSRLLYNELLWGWDEAKERHEEFQRTDDLAVLGLDASIDVKSRLLELRKAAYGCCAARADVFSPSFVFGH